MFVLVYFYVYVCLYVSKGVCKDKMTFALMIASLKWTAGHPAPNDLRDQGHWPDHKTGMDTKTHTLWPMAVRPWTDVVCC